MPTPRIALLFIVFLLPACALPAPPSPLMRNMQQINSNGSVSKLRETDLTAFQRLIQSRLPATPHIDEVFTLEADVPEGDGAQGAYVAILRSGNNAEFRYFEQRDHQPRPDRYFHRFLTTAETDEFFSFLKAHPPAQLRIITNLSVTPVIASNLDSPVEDDSAEQGPSILFRLTRAQLKEAQTLLLDSPTKDDHPAVDLINLIGQFRDAAPLACSYSQNIPLNAVMLFAERDRRVLRVWAQGNDVRAVIDPPLGSTVASEDEHWFAYHDQQWSPSIAPPPPATLPTATTAPSSPDSPAASQATTAPAAPLNPVATTHPVTPATEPSRITALGLLPETDTWTAEPGISHTMVWHYIPHDEFQGQSMGFVVPTFVFDEEHMCVDGQRLYLIHDGQLFVLPIPSMAMISGKK